MSEATPAPNRARFTLPEIMAACDGTGIYLPQNADADTLLEGVATDSRALNKGALFVALRGERFDGHDYLEGAAARGAAAAVVERLGDAPASLALLRVEDSLKALGALAGAHRRRFAVPVVGVTGSYGKTTTRALIAAALGARGPVLASAGNFNNEIGVPMTLFQLDETHGAAVLEMGMRGSGQIAYLAEIVGPTIGVITNIGPQHIELLGSLDNIAAAKAELLHALPSDGVAILPADDPMLPVLRDQAPCRIVTFGKSEEADYRVTNVRVETNGNVSFGIQHPTSSIQHLALPLPGEHNAINAAAALAVAGEAGVPLEDAARALQSVEVPGARMRVLQAGGVTIIDDSYNAGPNSMRAALETLRDFPGQGRRIAVLGAMRELGNFAPEEHRKIGVLAGGIAAEVIGVEEETRDLLAALGPNVPNQWCADASAAADAARKLVREGDVVLVKGSRSVGLETVVNALASQ